MKIIERVYLVLQFSREMLRGRTAVLVTHDRTEAVALADEVIEL